MAHYDCSCCGESMGISHDLCPRCKAGDCERSKGFYVGEIIGAYSPRGSTENTVRGVITSTTPELTAIYRRHKGVWSEPERRNATELRRLPLDTQYDDELIAKSTEVQLTR